MACDIASGRGKVCKDVVGGMKNIYAINDGAITGFTYDATNTDVIATVTGTPSAYKFELGKQANTYTETITSSDETGTTVFVGELSLNFPKLDIATTKNIKLLAWGNPKWIIETNSGQFLLVGKDRGCSVTGGTIATGGVMTDMSGYTLVLKSEEAMPLSFLDAANEVDLATMGFTVVAA